MGGQSRPIIQFVERPGIIDLGYGHPDHSSLPLERWTRATDRALRKHGWQALTYGCRNGPGPLIEWLVDRLGKIDGRAASPDETFITAGTSQALELVSGTLVPPGGVVLVDVPTYHLALHIFRDRDVEILPVPNDAHGIDPDGVTEVVRRLGERVSMLYIVPTFANPTGMSLSQERRRALVDAAARSGLLIVEDDTYRELSYTEDHAPPSLWSLAGDNVIRLGSFSKTVAPGIRLGWLTAPPRLVRRFAERGFVLSGAGVNHTTAVAMSEFGTSGDYDDHLESIRALYRNRRDTLAAALRRHAPHTSFRVPSGGWYLWLRLEDRADADLLLDAAESRGMSFFPGPRFHADPEAGRHHLRLAFSMLNETRLEEGARRLGEAIKASCA
jgi:2-aminoadipate transaminase